MKENSTQHNLIDRTLLNVTGTMAKIPDFSRNNRWAIMAFFTALTLVLSLGLPRFQLDQSMESFLKKNDPARESYRLFRYLFGSDEFVLVMYQPPDGDIFSPQSLSTVKKLEDELNKRKDDPESKLERITRVRSIISADYLESKGNALINRKFIGEKLPKTDAEKEAIRRLAMAHKEYPGSFFSKDSKYATIMIQTDYSARRIDTDKNNQPSTGNEEFDFSDPGESTNKNTSRIEVIPELEKPQMSDYSIFIDELYEVLRAHKWANTASGEEPSLVMNYAMAGNPYMMHFFDKIIMKEMGMIMAACIIIILITLAIAFRSLSAMVWPTIIIMLSILWTVGMVSWLGIVMSMMINIVIFLNLTVGIAASIHILSGYRYYMTEGENPQTALTSAFRKSGLAIMLATVTTMAGMLSLLVVPIIFVENFSKAATMGVFFAFSGTLFLLPVFLSFWAPTLKDEKDTNPLEKFFQAILEKIILTIDDRRKITLVVFLLITAFAASGYHRVIIDTNIVEQIKPGYGMKESYHLIDKYFGGTATAEIIIDTGQLEGMKNVDILNATEALAARVLSRRNDFVPRTNSLVKAAKESYKTMTDNSDKNYIIPQEPDQLKQILVTYDSADPETRKLIVDDDWRRGRLSLQVYNKSAYEYEEFMNQLDKWVKEIYDPLKINNPDLEILITGGIPMIMRMMSFISISQVKSFGLALISVCVILLIIYGSIKFGLLALIPNVFPIAVVLGVIGWFKIPLDSDTLLVMPIAIGIAVDDTIHFLTHYRTELLRGASREEAIHRTLREVGQAIMFTTLVLSFGFLAFVFSAYIPLTNFGVLSAIAITTALLGDLYLLPALLLTFKPFKDVTSAEVLDPGAAMATK